MKKEENDDDDDTDHDRKRLEMERDNAMETLRERDEECKRMRDVLNVIVGKYDFDMEDVMKETMETKNVTVEFSESFLGFTLLSTENAEHPAIISGNKTFFSGLINFAVSAMK